MNVHRQLLLVTLGLALALGTGFDPAAHAQQTETSAPPKSQEDVPPPPPVLPSPGQPPAAQPYTYEQRPPPARPPLVTPDQAQTIIARFRAAYAAMEKPRLLFYVNRELIDESHGLKLSARTENVTATVTEPTPRPSDKTDTQETRHVAENRYRNDERPVPSLADRQTARDVERLFGRPLRLAGATLADQRVATQMIASRLFEPLHVEGDQARKDREALAQVADVVIEILISSREVQASSFQDARVYSAPDIQATAIRLKDARILGQAATADLYGGDPSPAFARHYSVHSIAEATALALMEDIATSFESTQPTPAAKSPR